MKVEICLLTVSPVSEFHTARPSEATLFLVLIQCSLVPRPRPLMRKKGSGDLQPIPWLH